MLTLAERVIISNWLDQKVAALKENVNKHFKATGGTRDSIHSTFEGEVATIQGSSILHFGEDGRGVTKVSGPKGTGILRDIIREWIDVKGIVPKDNISKDSLAFLIARKIHAEGIKVPNKYNPGKILSSVINDKSVRELMNQLGASIIAEFESDILKLINLA